MTTELSLIKYLSKYTITYKLFIINFNVMMFFKEFILFTLININHLIRTFKKDTGMTPLKYIGLMKSELAVSYIRKGHSLEDIAELLGYSTVSALSVAFKNVTHKNLSEFR